MRNKITSKRTFIALHALVALSIISVIVAIYIRRQPLYTFDTPTPVIEWEGMGFKRRELEDALKSNLISEQQYLERKRMLLAQEDQIAPNYPRNSTEYDSYKNNDSSPKTE